MPFFSYPNNFTSVLVPPHGIIKSEIKSGQIAFDLFIGLVPYIMTTLWHKLHNKCNINQHIRGKENHLLRHDFFLKQSFEIIKAINMINYNKVQAIRHERQRNINQFLKKISNLGRFDSPLSTLGLVCGIL